MPVTRSQSKGGQSPPLEACLGEALNVRPMDEMRLRQGNAVVNLNLRTSGNPVGFANGESTSNTKSNVNIVDIPSVNNLNSVNTSSDIKISSCGAINCKLCKNLVLSNRVTSSVTGRQYDCIIPPGSEVNCKSSNLIYLLSCDNCKLQYVGQTVQPLHKRANGHRSGRLGQTGCKLLTEHMQTFPCSGYSFSVQVLQFLTGTGRLGSNEVDPTRTSERVSVEEDWMVKLRTVYPYGLNDKCHGRYWSDKPDDVYTGRSLFRKLDRTSNPLVVRCLKSRRNALPVNICLSEIENACNCFQNSNIDDPNPCAPCTLNFARISISRLTKPAS